MQLAFEVADQAGQAWATKSPGQHLWRKGRIVMALATLAPIPLGHMLGDHKGFGHQFDLLDNLPLVGDRHQSMGSVYRTARQLMQAVAIDVRWAKSRVLRFGMTRWAADFAALAPTQLLRRSFDNVTGGRFRRISGVFCGGRQRLNQLKVFGFYLRQARRQLSVALSQASILGFDLAAAFFPARENLGSDWATEDWAKLRAQSIHPDRLDGQRLLMETVVAAPPAAFSDTRPIGGGVTAATEAIFWDKGLG